MMLDYLLRELFNMDPDETGEEGVMDREGED